MTTERELTHSEQNAASWMESIAEYVAALECDYTRLEELKDERRGLEDAVAETADELANLDDDAHPSEMFDAKVAHDEAVESLTDWDDENGEELEELTEAAGEYKDADEARERVQESVLSVQVRSGWVDPGAEMEAAEFEILLTTGGPALRIMGELDEHKEPHRCWLEHQDWGAPWTHFFQGVDADALLTFAGCFYFGE